MPENYGLEKVQRKGQHKKMSQTDDEADDFHDSDIWSIQTSVLIRLFQPLDEDFSEVYNFILFFQIDS